MSTTLSTRNNEGDGWRDFFVLVATLFLGTFFVTLAAAIADIAARAEPQWQSVFGVLFVSLGYSLIATMLGLIPLVLYSFIYTLCVVHYRINYVGVIALATAVVTLFEMILQFVSSDYGASRWGFAVWGALHAIPTALVAHFFIKRLHRRRLTTSHPDEKMK